MVEAPLIERTKNFQTTWNKNLRGFPRYLLDFTWPSIAVLDLLTFDLRRKADLNPTEADMIHTYAAYIGGIAHDCWTQFPGGIEVQLGQDAKGDVTLSARKGLMLSEGESFSVNVSRSLREILTQCPNPLPVFHSFQKSLPPYNNYLSLFATGLTSGLCPYGVGKWRELEPKHLAGHIGVTEAWLAKTSSDWYIRNFPAEPLGRDLQLYRAQLILPPAGYQEPFPVCRAVNGLCRYLADQNISDKDRDQLLKNLACSPDDLMSSAAFVIASALSSDSPPEELRLIGESMFSSTTELRPALLFAGEIFQQPKDWLQLIEDGDLPAARKLFRRESALGFLNSLQLNEEDALNKNHLPFVSALAWNKKDIADKLLQQINSSPQSSAASLLQQGFIACEMGNFDRAEEILSRLTTLTINAPHYQMKLFELAGITAWGRGAVDQAEQCFVKGLTTSEADTLPAGQNLRTRLASLLISSNQHKKLKDEFQNKLNLLTPRLSRVVKLLILEGNENNEYQDLLTRIAREIPADRGVFHLAVDFASTLAEAAKQVTNH